MKSSSTSSTQNKGFRIIWIILLILFFLSAVLSICVGSVYISPKEVLKVLLGYSSDKTNINIVMLARVPRTIGCLTAGIALAVSGAIIQNVLNNPLAAPNIIGINSGAGFAVALCGAFIPRASAYTPIAAFIGAILTTLLILFIAERSGASKLTLVLAGIAISSLFGALIDAVITLFPDALIGYSDFRIGSMANLSTAKVLPAALVALLCFSTLMFLCNEMDILMLGVDTARCLGLNSRVLRIVFLSLAAILAGAAVSFAGLLGFVGLIVPHIARRFVSDCSRSLLCGSALIGGIMLTLCDILSRVIFAPYELPTGIILSVAGCPFFIWLIFEQRGRRTHD